MKWKPYPLSKVYRLLEPGPVVLLATAQAGRKNVMTLSWHTMLDFEPPLIGCVVSRGDYSFSLLLAARECVLAIPAAKSAPLVVRVGNCSGRDTDKFGKFRIRTGPASRVRAPLLEAGWANLECRVVDMSMVRKYNFFVLRVVRAWIVPGKKRPRTLHHMGRGRFMVAGRIIQLRSRMK
jgi:flavin reductase (DIM6/NTAB) family NADH-FMN oxidoreductase RutF